MQAKWSLLDCWTPLYIVDSLDICKLLFGIISVLLSTHQLSLHIEY